MKTLSNISKILWVSILVGAALSGGCASHYPQSSGISTMEENSTENLPNNTFKDIDTSR